VLFEQIIEIIDPEPHGGALNMALDEALLQCAVQPTLRIYRWREPSVSLGYFGTFAAAHDAASGREMVRRWTGGGLVEHGCDLTYTLIVPRKDEFFGHRALDSYRLIHESIAAWLGEAGIDATVAQTAKDDHSGACFHGHVRHDLLTTQGKVAGAAQRRTRWGLLHQGSIQLLRPFHEGSKFSTAPGRLATFFASEVTPMAIAPGVHETAEKLAREKYATEGWLRKF
jgi:lipoate-protein ligase A